MNYGRVYSSVLILILMEYSLTDLLLSNIRNIVCLNPYSNGILSDRMTTTKKAIGVRLNPYSNGILSDFVRQVKLSLSF